MAKVYKRENSPYYYFDIQVGSRRKRVSTKRTLKREAEAVADSYRTAELDRLQHGQGVQQLSLRDALFDHYLPTLKAHPRYRMYEQVCEKITGQVDGIEGLDPHMPFHEVTYNKMLQYRSKRRAQGAAASTVDHEIKAISAAYHIVAEDYRVRPALKFPIERPKGKPRFLLPDEERALLESLDPRRPLPARGGGTYLIDQSARAYRQRQDNYDLVVMLLDTGCRFGEIAKLAWYMVDTVSWKWLHIYRGKVDNEAQLAMTDRMREVLQRRFEERRNSVYVFPSWGQEKNEDVPRGSTQAIRRAMARVGINDPTKVARFGRRDVRSLRDTFATKLRMKGKMPLDRLQKLLGHASPAMTEKYADLIVDEASMEAVGILDKLNGG